MNTLTHSEYIARLLLFMSAWELWPEHEDDSPMSDRMESLTKWVEYMSGVRDASPS